MWSMWSMRTCSDATRCRCPLWLRWPWCYRRCLTLGWDLVFDKTDDLKWNFLEISNMVSGEDGLEREFSLKSAIPGVHVWSLHCAWMCIVHVFSKVWCKYIWCWGDLGSCGSPLFWSDHRLLNGWQGHWWVYWWVKCGRNLSFGKNQLFLAWMMAWAASPKNCKLADMGTTTTFW